MKKEKKLIDLTLSELVDQSLEKGIVPVIRFLDKDTVAPVDINDAPKTYEWKPTTTTVYSVKEWTEPELISADEYLDRIEFIYKEISLTSLTISTLERVFKIVFSCVDGKWHKSELIYGKIIPAQNESYEFD